MLREFDPRDYYMYLLLAPRMALALPLASSVPHMYLFDQFLPAARLTLNRRCVVIARRLCRVLIQGGKERQGVRRKKGPSRIPPPCCNRARHQRILHPPQILYSSALGFRLAYVAPRKVVEEDQVP